MNSNSVTMKFEHLESDMRENKKIQKQTKQKHARKQENERKQEIPKKCRARSLQQINDNHAQKQKIRHKCKTNQHIP